MKTIQILRTGDEVDDVPQFSSEQALRIHGELLEAEKPTGMTMVVVFIANQPRPNAPLDLRMGASGNIDFATSAQRAAYIKRLLDAAGESLDVTRDALSGHAGMPRA